MGVVTLMLNPSIVLADPLSEISAQAEGGAGEIALQRIAREQPPIAHSTWSKWERLRIQILSQQERNHDIVERVIAWPAAVELAPEVFAQAAQAASTLSDWPRVKHFAAQALWLGQLDLPTVKLLRVLVIASQAQSAQGRDAYLSMLRYEQDYGSADAVLTERFVNMLLDNGLISEAVLWLGRLNERSPAAIRLRVYTGVITPQAAVVDIRRQLSQAPLTRHASWWTLMLELAARHPNELLRVEALEHLLHYQAMKDGREIHQTATQLWQLYDQQALIVANARQLLMGDEVQWLTDARGQNGNLESRIIWAYLARRAQSQDVQKAAQQSLAERHIAMGLTNTSIRLFDSLMAPQQVHENARYVLGEGANAVGDGVTALRYWQQLPPPEKMNTANWQLRIAQIAISVRNIEAAKQATQLLSVDPLLLKADQDSVLKLAQQLLDQGMDELAEKLLISLLTNVQERQLPQVMWTLARTAQAQGQWERAGDLYMRVAVMKQAPLELIEEARLQAGNLFAKLGFIADSQRQFKWLITHSKDPVRLNIAKRALN